MVLFIPYIAIKMMSVIGLLFVDGSHLEGPPRVPMHGMKNSPKMLIMAALSVYIYASSNPDVRTKVKPC